MSKKKIDGDKHRSRRTQGRPRRSTRGVVALALASCLALGGAVFARWGAPAAPTAPGAATPAPAQPSFAPSNPAKEYVYAGGRLVATEEPVSATCTPPPSPPGVIIGEFRFRGAGGAADEFVELYNNSDSPVSVCAADGSAGWALATAGAGGSPAVVFVVPNGTAIPARGHYLATGSGYSLDPDGDGTEVNPAPPPAVNPQPIVDALNPKNPAGPHDRVVVMIETGSTLVSGLNQSLESNLTTGGGAVAAATSSLTRLTAEGDAHFAGDIPDDSGVALFATANPAGFTQGNRLDAAGFSSLAGADAGLYREGAGLSPAGGTDGEYSFVRKFSRDAAGVATPADTNDNASDFVLISTTGGTFGGVASVLGAPGPENLSSPIRRAGVYVNRLDQSVSAGAAPNRVRKGCATPGVEECDPNRSALGTMSFRRQVVNYTGAPVTRMRFRIVDITTLGSPNFYGGVQQADLRALSSGDITVNGVAVKGTAREEPPDQAALGGGLNASWTLDLESPLPHNGYFNVQFLLGVQQNGNYHVWISVEALP